MYNNHMCIEKNRFVRVYIYIGIDVFKAIYIYTYFVLKIFSFYFIIFTYYGRTYVLCIYTHPLSSILSCIQ